MFYVPISIRMIALEWNKTIIILSLRSGCILVIVVSKSEISVEGKLKKIIPCQ